MWWILLVIGAVVVSGAVVVGVWIWFMRSAKEWDRRTWWYRARLEDIEADYMPVSLTATFPTADMVLVAIVLPYLLAQPEPMVSLKITRRRSPTDHIPLKSPVVAASDKYSCRSVLVFELANPIGIKDLPRGDRLECSLLYGTQSVRVDFTFPNAAYSPEKVKGG